MDTGSGIYQIRNKRDGRIYIGQTINFTHRRNQHFSKLKAQCHLSDRLQDDYDKYGKDMFVFEIIERCDKDDLNRKERGYINILKPYYNQFASANEEEYKLIINSQLLYKAKRRARKTGRKFRFVVAELLQLWLDDKVTINSNWDRDWIKED